MPHDSHGLLYRDKTQLESKLLGLVDAKGNHEMIHRRELDVREKEHTLIHQTRRSMWVVLHDQALCEGQMYLLGERLWKPRCPTSVYEGI